MIVRAASADALVHVPRGDGELEPGASSAFSLSTSASARSATFGPAGAAPRRPHTARSVRGPARRSGRRGQPRRAEERRAEREVADGERGRRRTAARRAADSPSSFASRTSADDRAEETEQRARGSHPRRPSSGEPEPRVERRQHEHERVGLEHGEPDRDDPSQPRARRRSRRAARRRSGRPAERGAVVRRAIPARTRPRERGAPRTGVVRRTTSRAAAGAARRSGGSPQRAEPDEQPAERPDAETRALRTQAGLNGSLAPPPADDQVDDSESERHDGEDEGETYGPPARGPVGEEEAVGRAERSADAGVE